MTQVWRRADSSVRQRWDGSDAYEAQRPDSATNEGYSALLGP